MDGKKNRIKLITILLLLTQLQINLLIADEQLNNKDQECKKKPDFTLDSKAFNIPLCDVDIDISAPKFDNQFSSKNLDSDQTPTIRTNELNELENIQKTLLEAETLNRRRARNETRSYDKYLYYLDNFHLPAYTCKLPVVPNSIKDVNKPIYANLLALNKELDSHHVCLNQAAENERNAFKRLITNKLDGKIFPSKGNNIRWAVNSNYSQDTKNIMANIDRLYAERYQLYIDRHNRVQEFIRQSRD